jgi:hypothetical protein
VFNFISIFYLEVSNSASGISASLSSESFTSKELVNIFVLILDLTSLIISCSIPLFFKTFSIEFKYSPIDSSQVSGSKDSSFDKAKSYFLCIIFSTKESTLSSELITMLILSLEVKFGTKQLISYMNLIYL